jgi:peptidoglycan L-alanyl-D-glutamate endopeptidase CwlK
MPSIGDLEKAKLKVVRKDNTDGLNPLLLDIIQTAKNYVSFWVAEGLRTEERQRQLLEQGKTKTMKSKHLTGDAFDFIPYVNGILLIDDNMARIRDMFPLAKFFSYKAFVYSTYSYVASAILIIGKTKGVALRWGGDWDMNGVIGIDQTFQDFGHIELYG